MYRDAHLHVCGAFSNPRNFDVRGRLAKQWVQKRLDDGVTVHFIEHAFGNRPFLFDASEATHFHLVQIRGGADQELWLKEALLNRLFSAVLCKFPDAQHIVWSDTDIDHLNKSWVRDTQYMLEHNVVGQTWTNSIDLDPNGNIARNEWGNDADRSFCAAWVKGDVVMPEVNYTQSNLLESQKQSRNMFRRHGEEWDARCHYGYEWAGRASALKAIGGLIPWLITGSGDFNMAMAFAGIVRNVEHGMSPGFVRRLEEYARLCDRYIKQDIGVVHGTITHGWHGRKKDRQYLSRQDIYKNSGFDPDVDIIMDVHGLPTLCTDNRILRDGLRRYNLQRNEDSVDL